MEKKVLKFYVSPAVDTVEMEFEAQILAGSGSNADNATVEEPSEEVDL